MDAAQTQQGAILVAIARKCELAKLIETAKVNFGLITPYSYGGRNLSSIDDHAHLVLWRSTRPYRRVSMGEARSTLYFVYEAIPLVRWFVQFGSVMPSGHEVTPHDADLVVRSFYADAAFSGADDVEPVMIPLDAIEQYNEPPSVVDELDVDMLSAIDTIVGFD